MKKLISTGAFLIASFYWAQNYPVSSIPENLKKNATAVIREQSKTIEINTIDEIVYRNKTVITVLKEDSRSLLGSRISYDKKDVITNVKVNVYDENGKKIGSYTKGDFIDFVDNSQSTFFSDNRQLYHTFTPKSFPVTVEFSYDIKNENTVFIPDFTPFFFNNISLEKSDLKIINNSDIKLRTKVYQSPFNYTSVDSKEEGKVYTYHYENVPAINDEELVPSVIKILPKVSFSLEKFNLVGQKGDITSWKDFGAWYYHNLLKPVSVSTPEIKAEIAKLNLSGSIDDKVRKIFQFMQSKTRYVFVSLGIGGWQPMLPEEVQKKGYGDCKGLTNYMKTLLNEAGIKSYYAIINSNTSPISFDKDFPKMGGNHVILVVPTEKGNIWLENTSQEIAYNHLSYSTTDRNALLVKPTGIDIVNTPSYSPSISQEKQVVNIQLKEDLTIQGKANVQTSGVLYDYDLRFIYNSKDDQVKLLKKKYPSLNYHQLTLNTMVNDKNNGFLKYDFTFTAQDYLRNVGDDLILRAIPLSSRSTYHEDNQRTLPFEIAHSYQDNYDISYDVPTHYSITELPENITIKSEFGTYTLNFENKNGKLQIKRIVEVNKGLYPAEKYNKYVEFRNNTIKADNTKILISKKS